MTVPPARGRALVTGVNGFVGRTLARRLAVAGLRVVGTGREPAPHAEIADVLESYVGTDLRLDCPPVAVDAVVHLAGLASVGPSFAEPQRYITENTAMMTVLMEMLLRSDLRPRTVVVSSGAVYETPGPSQRVSESHPVAVTSPYVTSKLAVELQAAYYRRRGADVVVARPFNHIGFGQATGFLVPDLVDRLTRLASHEPLLVGDLSTARDYTDVRDVADAYLSMLRLTTVSEPVFNVASGTATTGLEILQMVCEAMGRDVPETVSDAPRKLDPSSISGDATRLRDASGWRPQVPLRDAIARCVSGPA